MKATAICCCGRRRGAGDRSLGGEPSAQYIASVHDLDGTPHFADPRNALAGGSSTRFSEFDMTPVGAVELEFFLMDREPLLTGKPKAPKALTNVPAPAALPSLPSAGSR